MEDVYREVIVESGGRPVVYAWDGRVLEVFGRLGAAGASQRFHRAAVDIAVEGPDRKGRYDVAVRFPGHVGCVYTYDAEALERLLPLLERVQAAATQAA